MPPGKYRAKEAIESEMRSMERDREWASMGLVQTDPCTWRSVLLLNDHNMNTESFSDSY